MSETTGGVSSVPKTTKTGSTESPHPRGGGAAKESTGGIGHGIKAAAAGVHGAGEKIRGKAAAAVDRTMDDPEGVQKNEAVKREGEHELDTGGFSKSTKEREGFQRSS